MMLLAAIDWHAVFFWVFALITCGFALAVLFSPNVVRMAFFLVISLGASAGLFFLTGAEFLAAMQLMIYVGGTLVLLVFGVMLTAQARFISLATPAGEWILAAIAGSALLSVLLAAALRIPDWTNVNPDRERVTAAELQATTPIGLGFAGVRVDTLTEKDDVQRQGMSGYLLPFLIVSVHLLVVLIGAAYMARAKRRASVLDETVY
jgi:NADH-quinone oxidoreductase subunit J